MAGSWPCSFSKDCTSSVSRLSYGASGRCHNNMDVTTLRAGKELDLYIWSVLERAAVTRCSLLSSEWTSYTWISKLSNRYDFYRFLYSLVIMKKPAQLSRYSGWLRAGRPRGRSSIPVRGQEFPLLHTVHTGSGLHSTFYPMGTGALSPRVKPPGRQADHSSPASVEVKKKWMYKSTSSFAFMA
jgi:hypothetical protein